MFPVHCHRSIFLSMNLNTAMDVPTSCQESELFREFNKDLLHTTSSLKPAPSYPHHSKARFTVKQRSIKIKNHAIKKNNCQP